MRRTVRRILTLLLVTLVLGALFTPPSAQAWGLTGHQVVAMIALSELTPNARKATRDVLSGHPEPQFREFVVASTWPDMIRDRPGIDPHKEWHFITIPFFDGVPPYTIRKNPENAVTALNHNVQILKGNTSQAAQAAALCWILHLVGDIHQPLHCCSRFTGADKAKPVKDRVGDSGGNGFRVKPLKKLHAYWDSGCLMFVDPHTRDQMRSRAKSFIASHPRSGLATELTVTDFEEWARESRKLAEEQAYAGLTEGEVVPDSYRGPARETAELRMVLAGYRLADLLNRVYP